jgi:NADH dehydrogenase [ubiquinone] 1 alpha subcomplex assembly factor 1
LKTPGLITDFSNLASQKWRITNDGVMGGLSESHFQINADGNAVFLGEISLKNNGGFASVKNHESLNLDGHQAIRLHIHGDGKRYSFRLQTGEQGDVHPWSYECRFDTEPGLWMEAELPLKQFTATYRGSVPKNVPDLDPAKIRRYGFLISDSQEGPFRLEISKIEVV